MKTPKTPTIAVLILLLTFGVSAAGKDEWLNVRSTNFNLIGNASEKEVRRVATKLEQFREAFRSIFPGAVVSTSIPTNVVVFKSDSSYRPFKPKRSDGKIDNFVAGYFQPGSDVNYITLSVGGPDADTYGTIYHEFVHFIVDTHIGKSGVPAWFNEGLAEYYQTFSMEDDIKATLGIPQEGHLRLLQQEKLLPLNSFFNTSNAALKGHGSGARSVFYAQAWAIVHYLIANDKMDAIGKFLDLSMKGAIDEAAFQNAFRMSYADLEKELGKYVRRGSYMGTVVTFKNKMTFDSEMTTRPLGEPEWNAYLGDLLYHTNRADDAETFLQTALAGEPGSSMANTSMGMVKIRQRKYDEAKAYLDKAIAGDPKNHLAYYHAAQLLSREGRDDLGLVTGFSSEKAARMRELLKKAIQIAPSFTESYDLLAYVDLVMNEQIDDGVGMMVQALKHQPGNQRYALRIAELYLRQNKFKEAQALAERIASTTDEPQVRDHADNVLKQIKAYSDFAERNEAERKRYEAAVAASRGSGGGRPQLNRRGAAEEPSPDEIKRREIEFEVRAINQELRKADASEVRFLGKMQAIDCKGGKISYIVASDTETFTLTSKDFQGVNLSTYVAEAGDAQLGCDLKVKPLQAVLTYKPAAGTRGAMRGELVSVEFVPDHFRLMDGAEQQAAAETGRASATAVEDPTPNVFTVAGRPNAAPQDLDEQRRKAVLDQIRLSLRQTAPGEVRVMGFIDKSECGPKGAFFFIRSGQQLLKLNASQDVTRPEMKAFTPEIENLQIGCGMKAVDIPVLATYRGGFDKKTKANGILVALEFVPKSFVLEP